MNNLYNTINMPNSLSNDLSSYKKLIDIYCSLQHLKDKNIVFEMGNTDFIAANLLSVLGCILDKLIEDSNLTFSFHGINPRIKNVMQRNGFSRYLRISTIADYNNTTIEYKIFKTTTEDLEDFERYTITNIINRNEMPNMSFLVKDRIISNILEIFNNVIDHAKTSKAYVCGQYFYKKRKLVITITDAGKTINQNVTEYFNKQLTETLKWAILPGNSTKIDSAPGGLGISMLLDFLRLNKGVFTLISGNEILEISDREERFEIFNQSFPGTIVSITFNLMDDFSYILNIENEDTIIF